MASLYDIWYVIYDIQWQTHKIPLKGRNFCGSVETQIFNFAHDHYSKFGVYNFDGWQNCKNGAGGRSIFNTLVLK